MYQTACLGKWCVRVHPGPGVYRASMRWCRKLEEKHALDLRALEQSEERFKARFLDARAQLAERDEQLLELRSRCTRKDSEITEMKQVRVRADAHLSHRCEFDIILVRRHVGSFVSKPFPLVDSRAVLGTTSAGRPRSCCSRSSSSWATS